MASQVLKGSDLPTVPRDANHLGRRSTLQLLESPYGLNLGSIDAI